ncbi:FecR domain-containing protein [Oxalicibacterium faecigallinarum]|uniref:DUF4880 domain-containing protein n=1 Tax=Oxalicibacterium faecigallinarum TaxID=573741 RepID=A0A8J3F0S6_9BURK|nr:FecR domain-containing protein [Oxalicibacterium faecigallinarum]GGI16657.1 hypothetical protein GCM10008066_05060 [Oxalicibacterium faecigallinarum]
MSLQRSLLTDASTVHSPEHVRAVNEAAQWYARLQANQGSDALRGQWAQWLAADPEHGVAWEKVERVCQQFGRVPAKVAGSTLARSVQHARARRGMLRGFAILLAGGAGGLAIYRSDPLHVWHTDYATRTGERRDLVLADLSRLSLNTASRVDVAFSATQRLVELYAGEILVTTHPDTRTVSRPFVVETVHGRITALGTRFNVRMLDNETRVTVLEKAVEVRLAQPANTLQLTAGQQISFTATGFGVISNNEMAADAWHSGRLVVVDMPLRTLLAELSRYRSGYLACDDEVANIRVSGAFPLDDIDQTLLSLTESFPLRIDRFTRFWTVLKAGKSV